MSKLKKYKMFINGEWIDSESKKTFQTLNPESNDPWAEAPEANEKDIDNIEPNKPSNFGIKELYS